MKKYFSILAAVAVVFGLASCEVIGTVTPTGSTWTANTNEIETNDISSEATSIGVGVQCYATLSESDQVDFFKVPLTNGVDYKIGAGPDDRGTGANLDIEEIAIYDINANLVTNVAGVDTAVDGTVNGMESVQSFVAPSTGTFFIRFTYHNVVATSNSFAYYALATTN